MILQLVQTHSALAARYQILGGGSVLYTGEAPAMRREIVLMRGEAPLYLLRGNLMESLKPSRQNARSIRPMDICRPDGDRVGEIFLYRERGWFKPSWFQMELEGRSYRIYEVGLGKEGIKYPVYDGARQIALLEKSPVVKDNLDEYTICVPDWEAVVPCALFGLYYDFVRFGNRGEFVKQKTEVKYVYTNNKTVRGMYDPGFRARCGD